MGLALKFLKLRVWQFKFVFGLKLFETNVWFQKIYLWSELARSLISQGFVVSSSDSTDKEKFGQGADVVHKIIQILRNMPGQKQRLE